MFTCRLCASLYVLFLPEHLNRIVWKNHITRKGLGGCLAEGWHSVLYSVKEGRKEGIQAGETEAQRGSDVPKVTELPQS